MRRYSALVNPVSGDGTSATVWRQVASALHAQGIEVDTINTVSRDHAIAAATQAAAEKRIVVAVGGDGLVRDVATAVAGSNGAMAIVPTGRGNDFARLRGIPSDPSLSAAMLLDGQIERIDVAQINEVTVPGNVYVGVDSLATRIINANRWVPALLLYRIAPVRALASWRSARYTVTLDGATRSFTGHTAVIANSGVYGHGLKIVPSAQLDDGQLDVMTIGDLRKSAIVSFMRQAKHGTHVSRSDITIERAHTVTIDCDRDVPVCADGDEIATLPVTVRVRPRALPLVTPV